MKFRSLIAIAAFTFMSVAVSAQEWTVNKIMDSVTVLMPGTAKQTEKNGQVGHELRLNDSTKYSFLYINFEDFGLNEEALGQMVDTDEFAEQYKMGISQQGEIVSEKKGKLDDKYTYFEYEMKIDENGVKKTGFIRTTFYKAYGIATVYSPGQKGTDAANRDKYFNSLKIGK
ncbi:MAG: hypothetical protein EOO09_16475 [Chitinophagaceae bacterium]|nr:MAG: hypothetical protein EOO09_16475 [Chitinophagaceae bacterium]